MNLANYIQFLEPLQENVSRVYSTASEIITVLLVLWFLNFIAGLIQRTYATGKAFGGFYRNYLHRTFQSMFLKIISFGKNKSQSGIQSRDSSNQTRQVTF
tara:strand:+ start:2554 stop:2853 length:300 start_codon:yes stop_codon:yes gene_type:complete